MFEAVGCMDQNACNYDEEATDADNSCTHALPEYNCDGTCISDQDGDLICDGLENPPNLYIPEDITKECDETDFGNATAEGGRSAPVITYPDFILDGDCPNNYTILRSFFASDNCGNVTSLVQTITVVDTKAPEFTFVPEDYTITCNRRNYL